MYILLEPASLLGSSFKEKKPLFFECLSELGLPGLPKKGGGGADILH